MFRAMGLDIRKRDRKRHHVTLIKWPTFVALHLINGIVVGMLNGLML